MKIDPSKKIIPVNAINFTKRVERPHFNERDYTALDQLVCAAPFRLLNIMMNGDVIACPCSNWVKTRVGNVLESSLLDIFKGQEIRSLRRSVMDGSYSQCDKTNCAYINDAITRSERGTLMEVGNKVELIKKGSTALSEVINPYQTKLLYVGLHYDMSCNLKCVTCRPHTHLFKKGEVPDDVLAIHQHTVDSLYELIDAGFQLYIFISGSADPFASVLFKEFIETFNFNRNPDRPAKLQILTNGILLTEKTLSIPWIAEQMDYLCISMDAATQHTYENVMRLNGDWDKLLRNVENAKAWIGKQNRAITFATNFTVTAKNYHEMPIFVDMAVALGFNHINFITMDQPHFMSDEQYQEFCVDYSSHPDHHNLIRALNDVRMQHPIANLGNLRHLIQ